MLKDLAADQLALARYMSDLSEESYYAGWMEGLEYALWQVVLGERRDYGHLTFTSEHADNLRRMSVACGGWIVFDAEKEETWIPSQDWVDRFSAWRDSPRQG